MTSLSESIGYWLIDYYALATVVLLATLVILKWQAQPARRLSVAWPSLCGLWALAIVTALPFWPRTASPVPADRQPLWRPPVSASLPPSSAPASSLRTEPGRALTERSKPPLLIETTSLERAKSTRVDQASQPSAARVPGAKAAVDHRRAWLNLARWAFSSGAAVMVVWLVVGYWHTALIRRRSVPAPRWTEDSLARLVGAGRAQPELLLSDRLRVPAAVGLWRPAIILPRHLVEVEPRHGLDAALAHEWAHIKNGDLWLIALSRLLLPVLFAHPAYWWLRGRVRDDQEVLADATASAKGRVEYAGVLLSWAVSASQPPRLTVAFSLALWERPSQLKRRIVMLLDPDFRVETTCPKQWRRLVAAGTALGVLSLSVLTFRPAAVAADPLNDPVLHREGEPPGEPHSYPARPEPRPPGTAPGHREGEPPGEPHSQRSGATIRIVEPDGNPAARAQVYKSDNTFRSLDQEPGKAILLGQTAPDGSFTLSPEDAQAARDRNSQIVVMAEGFGPAFVDPSVGDGVKLLHLAKDDVPIRGRVLDVNGQPVAGATIQLVGILWHPTAKLDEWLTALGVEKVAYPVTYDMLRWWSSTDVPSLYREIVTDRDGRFTVNGVGRERIASLLIAGPRIETRFEFAATRQMPAVKVPDFDRQNQYNQITYHGALCDLVAGPGLEVVGTVRDKDTGKPIAGARVQTASPIGNPLRFLKTTTDQAGRYRLTSIPLNSELVTSVPDGPAYLQSIQHLDSKPADTMIVLDFALKRGVLARGRITDKRTGKPIRANLDYFILEDNPHFKEYPSYGTIRVGMPFQCDEDGNYKIVVIPGRGILGARFGNEGYRMGVGFEKIKGMKESLPGTYRARPFSLNPKNYNVLVEIEPKPGDESVTANLEFDPGRTVKGRLQDKGGEPVSGALMMGAEGYFQHWSGQPLPTAEFQVHSLGADDTRGLLFYHENKKLAGAYVMKPGETGPITVTLEPSGTVTGRLMDNGLPWAGAQMTCDRPFETEMHDARYEYGSLPSPILTDKDGRFEAHGLVPGLKYTLRAWKGRMIVGQPVKDVVVKAGETKDLGNLKATY
jgi:beta-lactamase regulating signal transducer with metallopeptidase domain